MELSFGHRQTVLHAYPGDVRFLSRCSTKLRTKAWASSCRPSFIEASMSGHQNIRRSPDL
jgi:hypothetical protein